ncbi:MAG: hypothetical protein R2731_03255 [Nocardioides sp.]
MTSRPAPAAWRAEVLALRDAHRSRSFPPALYVGIPGGLRRGVPADAGLDHGLRADLTAALLARHRLLEDHRPAVAWLCRPGLSSWHDLDAAWLPAVAQAFLEAGEEPGFVVLTRTGWYDPRTGEGRSWKRLRHRSRRPADPGP